MSNQRPGKKQSRPDILGQDMGILKFFKIAQKVLEKENLFLQQKNSILNIY